MSLEDGLEGRFWNAVERWEEHCKKNAHHSSVKRYVDCDAYREIVSMGKKALLFIRKLYDEESEVYCFLSMAVSEIVGNDFKIPLEISGKRNEIQEFTKKWLDKNMPQHIR